jgi:hypothetical protein
LYDCKEVLSKYRQEGISISVPDKKHILVEQHHLHFLEYMSDDLKTTKVLDESFMKLLRTINSDLDDLKVCWWCFLCFQFLSFNCFGIISLQFALSFSFDFVVDLTPSLLSEAATKIGTAAADEAAATATTETTGRLHPRS